MHEFLAEVLKQANVGPLPWAGTPEWCAMADDDQRKLLALASFGEHHALRVEVAQDARAQAMRDASAGTDWTGVARNHIRHQGALRSGAYIRRTSAAPRL